MRSGGLERVQLEASAFTDERVLGRSGRLVRFRHGEFEVLSRHPGGLGGGVKIGLAL